MRLYSLALTPLALALASAAPAPGDADSALSIPQSLSAIPSGFRASGDLDIENSKLVLTRPGKPNQKSALWSTKANPHAEWTLEASILANGPEKSPGGGIALWYAAEPAAPATGPVYGSPDYWDGLAIILDSADIESGTLRGHLNDGSIEYSAFKDPVERAFSLCRIGYKNTGSPFTVKVGYGKNSIVVEVNGHKCFETDQVVLPPHLHFGISAASTQDPDAFVVEKFQVYPKFLEELDVHRAKRQAEQNHDAHDAQAAPPPPPPPPAQAHSGVDSKALQDIQSQVSQVSVDVKKASSSISNFKSDMAAIDARIQSLEKTVDRLMKAHSELITADNHKHQLSQEVDTLRTQLDNIHRSVSDHNSVLGSIPDTVNQALAKGGPSIWVLLVVVVAIQGILIVGYNVYRTRRSYHAKIL